MVDHTFLLTCLNQHICIQGITLKWFTSFLSNGSFSVMIEDLRSSASVFFRMQQGSILAFIVFSLLLLGSIVAKHDISFLCYLDDLQIYLPVKPTERNRQKSLYVLFIFESLYCIANINHTAQNCLHCYEEKMADLPTNCQESRGDF